MPIGVDLTELDAGTRSKMKEVLTSQHAFQIVQAKIRQQQIAKFYHDNRPRAVDGFGGMDMSVDPFWVSYFNMKYGHGIMDDPEFRKWLNKNEDWFKVRHAGTKLQVGYGSALSGARKTFSKCYPAAIPNDN